MAEYAARFEDDTGGARLVGNIEFTGATEPLSNAGGTVTGNQVITGNLTVNGNSVLGNAAADLLGFHGSAGADQAAAIADAAGGATVDAEARTAVNAILAALRETGYIAT